ncbi:MAG: glycosyltransferase family 39 protein [Ardenticatenales bacterium]|nr:glycosyltransferase family 39 protein [Ardenticatenales bacterium]
MSDGSMDGAAVGQPHDRRAIAFFALAMVVYLITRLYALDRFPIFFHADEAFGPLTASSLLTNGLSDAYQRLLPIYFEPAPNRWMPIGTVYAHLVTVALFGKSIIVTRVTTALVTAAGAAAVALALRDGFRARRWWAGALVLGAMPTWFLHSRTGFEAAMMTAAFAVFLWAYLRYRQGGGRFWSCAAVAAGAATFYAYSNGQSLMAVLGILLLVVDSRFHWSQRRALGPALALGLVLLIPFVRFRLAHPGAEIEHLRAIDSYIVDPAASAGDKALGFARRYAFGLHPRFWFISHDVDNPLQWAEERWPAIRPALMLGGNLDIERHRYRGRGHIALWMLPFFVVGLVAALRRWRSPAHRTVLLAALATPFGAATAGVGVTRVLAFVVPAAVLITLGIEAVIDVAGRWLARERASTRAWASSLAVLAARWRSRAPGVATGLCFVALAGANFELLTTALRTGDRWYDDYGLYGMQWGAAQLFDDMIPSLLAADPDVHVLVTSDWANAADRLPYFFLDFDQTRRVRSRSVSDPLTRLIELSDDEIWIVTDHELDGVRKSGKFAPPEIVRTLNWPDGRPGFHAVRLRYAPGIDKGVRRRAGRAAQARRGRRRPRRPGRGRSPLRVRHGLAGRAVRRRSEHAAARDGGEPAHHRACVPDAPCLDRYRRPLRPHAVHLDGRPLRPGRRRAGDLCADGDRRPGRRRARGPRIRCGAGRGVAAEADDPPGRPRGRGAHPRAGADATLTSPRSAPSPPTSDPRHAPPRP